MVFIHQNIIYNVNPSSPCIQFHIKPLTQAITLGSLSRL